MTAITTTQNVIERMDSLARDKAMPTYSDLAETLDRLLSLELPDVGAVRTARKQLAKIEAASKVK